jgi:predicted RNA-binding protein with RPS1 domain
MDGVVTSVIESGTFVRLGDTGAEGMLRVTNLKPGAKVRVKISAVDTVEGKIDLAFAQAAGGAQAQWRVTPRKSDKKNRR